MDQEASILFPTMCDKLQKAMAIRPEYDITKEIITEQYQSDQQKRRYAPKLQQTAVMLFADFFIFIGLLLLFYSRDTTSSMRRFSADTSSRARSTTPSSIPKRVEMANALERPGTPTSSR